MFRFISATAPPWQVPTHACGMGVEIHHYPTPPPPSTVAGRRPMSQETNELIVPLRLPAPGFQSDQQLSVGDVLDPVHQSQADCQERKTNCRQPARAADYRGKSGSEHTTPHRTMTAKPLAWWLADPRRLQTDEVVLYVCLLRHWWNWTGDLIMDCWHVLDSSCRYFQGLTFIQWGCSLSHTAYYCYSYLVYKLHYPWALEAQLFVLVVLATYQYWLTRYDL